MNNGLVAVISAMVCGAVTSAVAAETGKPNILLILADDLGWSDLGCYGGEISTPNLDALAKDGLQFREFYNSARCSPSRAGILSGLDPHLAGFQILGGKFVRNAVTIPEVLKHAGYRSCMVGKWHLGTKDTPVDHGFDEYYGFLGGFNSYWSQAPYVRLPEGREKRVYPEGGFYSTDAFADYTQDFIGDAQKKNQPWFLYLAFNAPHFPLHAPEADIEKYEAMYFEKGWDGIREERLARQKKLGLVPPGTELTPRPVMPSNAWNEHTGWADKEIPAWNSLPEDRRHDLARRMAVYAAAVDRMDRAVGQIVASLKTGGQLDNTLIFFLSDNGACAEWDPWGFDTFQPAQKLYNILHTGDDLKKVGGPDSYISYGSGWANACNTPWRLFKHYCQEGGTRTACIIHWPAGLKTKGVVQNAGDILDFMPTICALTGAEYPKTWNGTATFPLEGVSLLPVFSGQPPAQRLICREHEGNRSIRDGDWKLVALEGKPWELYNLVSDPVEMHDLAMQQPERVSGLDAAWRKWAARNQVEMTERRQEKPVKPAVPTESFPGTPQIAGNPITIRCDVDTTATDGVILAHGGRECGYALYLKDGHPVFTVRTDEKTAVSITSDAVSGKFSLLAALRADGTMTLSVNGGKATEGKVSGLILKQPKDGLSIGKDDLSAVGAYKPPNLFTGTVTNVKITTDSF
ncbi:MAG: sulfatase-like hydrolase/transferase [Kiritimatiellales bacterium]|jgi:arylsulfatase